MIKCTLCGEREARGEGTGLCDPCWELDRRIRSDPGLASQILNQIWTENLARVFRNMNLMMRGWEEIDDIGNVMSLEDFRRDVEANALIDYDGYGCFANKDAGLMDPKVSVYPSEFERMEIPLHATHIIWYNR